MDSTQNHTNANYFIDFVPAELKENKTWKIVYYVKCPIEKCLKRKQHRVRPLKNYRLRKALAQQMVLAINNKLSRGWNPLHYSKNIKALVKFSDVSKLYLQRCQKDVENEVKRVDTLRSYKSNLNNVSKYLKEINEENMFVLGFTDDLVRNFIDYIYYQRENSARTRNNYLKFLRTFSDWLLRHKYISVNPTSRLEFISEKIKKREVIPQGKLSEIFNYLKKENKSYFTLCFVAYYCLIRRTELTKLKVKDVILINGIIYIEGNTSKNKKSKPVTIPDILLPILAKHLIGANAEDYLFSRTYFPGAIQLPPKKISDEWVKVRKAMQLPRKYQWYSLKDTGITNLLKAGVTPIVVRDQARHYSIIQTEAYTPKEIIKANPEIKNILF